MKGMLAAILLRRTPREQVLLAAALGLVLVWGAAVAVWQPLLSHRAELRERITQTDQMLVRAARLPPPAGTAAAAAVADDRPLGIIATATAADMGLSLRRLQPQGEALEVTLEDSPFDLVLLWIAALEGDHGLRLSDLRLTRLPEPGTVSASLTLER